MKTSRYVYNDNDGTVLDTSTRLMWMRCALGQKWDGKTCVGEPEKFTFEEACNQNGDDFAGYDDWRPPTIEELKTLVDNSQSGAKINPLAFPNCPASFFWSSSVHAYHPYNSWGVYFYYGRDDYHDRKYYLAHVRLVRGGQ